MRAGPTSCLSLWALGGRGELRALLSQSLPLQKKKNGGSQPTRLEGSSLRGSHLPFAGRGILREGQTVQPKGRVEQGR